MKTKNEFIFYLITYVLGFVSGHRSESYGNLITIIISILICQFIFFMLIKHKDKIINHLKDIMK